MADTDNNTAEVWRPCPGFEDLYSISSFGRLRSDVTRHGTRAGRVLKIGRDTYGYPQYGLSSNGKLTSRKAHRLVAEAFLPPPTGGTEINHKDGDKTNNCPENLEYCTPQENHTHRRKVLGMDGRGEHNGRTKLTAGQVIEIRRRYARGGISQQRLADEHGVSQPAIGFIIRRVHWSHI